MHDVGCESLSKREKIVTLHLINGGDSQLIEKTHT